jgi:hypothetical protein
LVLAGAVGCGIKKPSSSDTSPVVVVLPADAPPDPVGWCPSSGEPSGPLAFARCSLSHALGRASLVAEVAIITADDPAAAGVLSRSGAALDARPESFVVTTVGDTTFVVGRDATGALYGAQALAERIAVQGPAALPVAPVLAGAPSLAIRAANPFLLLQRIDEPAWFFLSQDFWRQYLDLLLAARINFLDLHGMYSVETTVFPNALLYFATSKSFPAVGVPAADREKNLAMLGTVVSMAAARGIKVGLMSYRADTSLTGDDNQMLTDDAQVKLYTREAVEDLARRVPGLWRLGFRIGESARSAAWYEDTFVAGIQAAGTGVGLSTRTWGASKPDILNIVAAAGVDDTIVEAKFNGEHLGAPYAIQGGLVATSIGGYSFQDFLNPPVPYHFVFQLRAGGTHRIFRYASYERTRRTVKALTISPAVRGFTLEPPHAYFPAQDYYHANRGDRFSDWTFQRDELAYLLFGRLGYDPETPEAFFRQALAARLGSDALWDAMQAASDVVPWLQTAHTCGLDSRDQAPELELGGDVGYWASPWQTQSANSACGLHRPMDSFAVALPDELADDLVSGRPTTRISPLDVARVLLDDAAHARVAGSIVGTAPASAETRDVVRECTALADLATYFAHKLRAASALAVFQKTGRADYRDTASSEAATSAQARRQLAADTRHIAPFADHLRMAALNLGTFHWSRQLDRLAEDQSAIDAISKSVAATPPPPPAVDLPEPSAWLGSQRAPGPGLQSLEVSPPDPAAAAWVVTARLASPAPPGTQVRILWKPFNSQTEWRSAEATATSDGSFAATIDGGAAGGFFAAEVVTDVGGWRYPNAAVATPYIVLPP